MAKYHKISLITSTKIPITSINSQFYCCTSVWVIRDLTWRRFRDQVRGRGAGMPLSVSEGCGIDRLAKSLPGRDPQSWRLSNWLVLSFEWSSFRCKGDIEMACNYDLILEQRKATGLKSDRLKEYVRTNERKVTLRGVFWKLARQSGRSTKQIAEVTSKVCRSICCWPQDIDLSVSPGKETWLSLGEPSETVSHKSRTVKRWNLTGATSRLVHAISSRQFWTQYRHNVWVIGGPLGSNPFWLMEPSVLIPASACWDTWVLVVNISTSVTSRPMAVSVSFVSRVNLSQPTWSWMSDRIDNFTQIGCAGVSHWTRVDFVWMVWKLLCSLRSLEQFFISV